MTNPIDTPAQADELEAKIAIRVIQEFQSVLGQRTENMKFYGARMSEDEANNLAVQRMEQRVAQLLKDGTPAKLKAKKEVSDE